MPDPTLTAVKFSGAIELPAIEAAFENLKSACGAGAGLEIDLADVTALDLTLVQLIESARRHAAASGMAIRLKAPAHGVVKEALRRGGFLSEPPDARTRFWLCQ